MVEALPARDKASLDIFRFNVVSLEESDSLPDPDVIARITADGRTWRRVRTQAVYSAAPIVGGATSRGRSGIQEERHDTGTSLANHERAPPVMPEMLFVIPGAVYCFLKTTSAKKLSADVPVCWELICIRTPRMSPGSSPKSFR